MPPEPFPLCDYDCGKRTTLLHLALPADIASIGPAVQSVVELVASEMPDRSEMQMEIGLALQEALANAVVHGCGSVPARTVDCWVACDAAQGLAVVVRDPGAGFDLDDEPLPLEPENLGIDHGRGIHLIRELMDEVHFQRKGAEIHMRKK